MKPVYRLFSMLCAAALLCISSLSHASSDPDTEAALNNIHLTAMRFSQV